MSEGPGLTTRPGRRPISRGRLRFFVVTMALGVLGFCEVAARIVFPAPEVEGWDRTRYAFKSIPDSIRGTIQRDGMANAVIRHECEPDGFRFDSSLNLYGFRGPDFALDPSPDRHRVVFVGDSFVEGLGAGDGDTIPVQFARDLDARGRPVEAINLGISGAGFSEYVRIVRDCLTLLKPRTIVLVTYANDFPAPPLGEANPPEKPDRKLSPYVPRIIYVLDRLRRGLPVPKRFRAPPMPAHKPVPAPLNRLTTTPPPPETEPALVDAFRRGKGNPGLPWLPLVMETNLPKDLSSGGGAREHLAQMADDCRRAGVRLIVVYVPFSVIANPAYLTSQNRLHPRGLGTSLPLDSPRYLGQQAHLREVTRELGLPFLDLTAEFIRAERAGRRLYWPIDTHATPDGYRLAAALCARYWSEGTTPSQDTVESYQSVARAWSDTIRR